jgi:endonuclease/exonuclease/phosphatase family metal-dependent hydrolase
VGDPSVHDPTGGVPPRAPGCVRLLAYNVRSLRDGRHGAPAVVRACDADLVCVQEAPRFWRWRARCAAFAREAGLVVLTGGRTAAGTLLLGAHATRLVHAEDVLLPATPGLHRRGMALATVDVAGTRLTVASLHLGLRREERLAHVPHVLAHLDRVTTRDGAAHRVLAGDVNEPAGRRTWRVLGRELVDAYAVSPSGGSDTFPARAPTRRVDGVLADRGLEVVRCGVPDVPGLAAASDHRPVLADLRPSQEAATGSVADAR